jgi:PAT family beta-lactamase induction signal transducer AmpG
VTQYALFTSLFGLPRLVAGPITGFTVHAVGWTSFFWMTMLAGIPGLLLLARFVPPGTREPTFTVAPPRHREPLSSSGLAVRAGIGGVLAFALAVLAMATLSALHATRADTESGFDLPGRLAGLLRPADLTAWLMLLGAMVFGVVCGLLTAAVFAARHGAWTDGDGAPSM